MRHITRRRRAAAPAAALAAALAAGLAGAPAAWAEGRAPASAQAPAGQGAPARVRDYAACVALLDADPAAAREAAAEWRRFGGGAQAGICEALALSALGAQATAARLLDQLAAEEAGAAPPERLRAMRALAADLWLAARRPEQALASLAAALDLAPGDPALLAARAQARAMTQDWAGARADLDAALRAAPGAPALLVARAQARAALGDAAGALADAEAALAAAPEDAQAWLEAGRALEALGRRDAARERYLGAIARDRQGPTGAAARRALQLMEAGG
ncbi:hypothetical protein [Oceanicella actignis]|uniref:hypothetical protein n=1 Tax=Oceanicella actignis TaxID=1189325 RepID=UPI0011E6DECF|nr:hypothetical protein [Oceanicella actignis]TYO89095.1 Tetratricopeptide repeat-containing protein [Oceanicella actignis]